MDHVPRLETTIGRIRALLALVDLALASMSAEENVAAAMELSDEIEELRGHADRWQYMVEMCDSTVDPAVEREANMAELTLAGHVRLWALARHSVAQYLPEILEPPSSP